MNRLTIAGTVERTVSPIGNSDKVGEFLLRVVDRVYNRETKKAEEGHSFVAIKVFGKSLGVAKAHLKAGAKCLVVGKVEGREYNGKYYTSVVAEEVLPIVGGEQQGQDAQWKTPQEGKGAPSWTEVDDIPF